MLDTLKQSGRKLGQEIGRAWDSLAEGWREMFSRSSNALTQFVHGKEEQHPVGSLLAPFPHWSLLAGEVEETDKEIVVRLELPGMQKEDCQITVDGNVLSMSAAKSTPSARAMTAPTMSWSAPTARSSAPSPCRAMSSPTRPRPATRTA